MDVFVVKNWEKRFEGAKTKTYNNKTTCSMPNKHGLGYRKLVKAKNGPAMFGAWCALLQVLSRHEIPRQGYCTDTGSVHGNPYTTEDLELVTDIPKKIFDELFPLVLRLGWVEVRTLKDSTGIVQSPLVSPKYPLNSDLDSNLDSNLDSDSDYTSSDGEDFLKRFNDVTGKSHRKLVEKAMKQFKARLKDGYSIDDIIQATRNAACDRHHVESGFKHLTPELITREDKLDAWLNAKKRATFDPPTSDDAVAYIGKYAIAHKLIVDNKYCGMTAERFINHYGATNWKRKGEQIEDWEGLLANFIMSDYNRGDIARAN